MIIRSVVGFKRKKFDLVPDRFPRERCGLGLMRGRGLSTRLERTVREGIRTYTASLAKPGFARLLIYMYSTQHGMEACLAAEREEDKVLKKLRTLSGSASEKLQKIIEQVNDLKDQIEAGMVCLAKGTCFPPLLSPNNNSNKTSPPGLSIAE